MAVINRSVDLSVVGANGGGWVTDLGAAPPPVPTAYNSAIPASMLPLGAVSEKGLGYGFAETAQQFIAWGQLTPYRTQITRSLRTFKVDLWETSRAIVKSVMYRQSVSAVAAAASGDYTFQESSTPTPDRRSWIFDVMDGQTLERFFVPSGEVTDRNDVNFKMDEISGYSLTITAFADTSGVTVYHLGHIRNPAS